jgi:hypothetical protein
LGDLIDQSGPKTGLSWEYIVISKLAAAHRGLTVSIMKNFLCLTILPLISACHPTSLSQSESDKIEDVEVRLSAPMPKSAVYVGPLSHIGASFGLVGWSVGAIAAQGPKEEIEKFVEQQKIDLGPVVLAELKYQLSQRPRYANRIKDGAPTKIDVEINGYGLYGDATLLRYRPYLDISVKLTDHSGNIIWSDHDDSVENGVAPKLPFDTFLSSPDVFRAEFDPAIRRAVARLLARLEGSQPQRTYARSNEAVMPQYAAAAASSAPSTASATAASLPLALQRAPYLDDAHQAKFRKFLTKPMPRAFAISDDGHAAAAWGIQKPNASHPADPATRALEACRQEAGKECILFAVDDKIVFQGK